MYKNSLEILYNNEHLKEEAKGKFCFLSFGKFLNVQKAWLLIVNYMRSQIAHAIEDQMVSNIFKLKNTTSFEICRQDCCVEGYDAKKGDFIFHVPLAITKVSPEHYAELFRNLQTPIVTVGQQNKPFCTILTTSYKPNMKLLVSKEIAEHYSEWKTNINIDLLRSSYSIPIYLYIINHIQHGQTIVNVELSDFSHDISAGKYEYFCDFRKRILKPVKADFDKGLLTGVNSFTFDYEIKKRKHVGKKSEISLILKLINRQEVIQKEKSIKKQNKMESIKKYGKYMQLLKANKNLILTGAPGMGKTFLAKEIAKSFIMSSINIEYPKGYQYDAEEENNRICNQHIKMVQFHPSTDYSDFVEGLRPVKSQSGDIIFQRVNGTFKEFCETSLYKSGIRRKGYNFVQYDSTGVVFDFLYNECYESAIREIQQNGCLYSYKENVSVRNLIYDEFHRSILCKNIPWVDNWFISLRLFYALRHSYYAVFEENIPSYEEVKNKLEQFCKGEYGAWIKPSAFENSNDEYWPSLKIESESKLNSLAIYYFVLFDRIINYVRQNFDIVKFPTVFIIDEINRGEISKILGELFFCIDPGYRGGKNRVCTQYQNMVEEVDIFKEGFFVPENVYIIGTMNDIDRSVESMDFAMRRRFAFEEVSAEESYQNMIAESSDFTGEEKTEIKQRMSSLNKAILKPELRLGKAYQIGAAYFRKLLYYKEQGMEMAFKLLWNNHLKGLLFEYLRGNPNAQTQLEELEKAYNKKAVNHKEK